MWMFLTKEI